MAPHRLPMSFSELPDRLQAIRAALNHFGIGCGDLVATALPDSAETAVCLMGLMSSAIAAPLNPSYSEAEFARYLSRLRPKALIVPHHDGDDAKRQARILQIPTIELVPEMAGLAGSFEMRSDLSGTPTRAEWNVDEDTGLILLTSGSTGHPKLIPYRVRLLVANAKSFSEIYRV